MNKIFENLEKAVTLALGIYIAYTLVQVTQKSVEVLLNNINSPYSVCAIFGALQVLMAYIIAKQGVPQEMAEPEEEMPEEPKVQLNIKELVAKAGALNLPPCSSTAESITQLQNQATANNVFFITRGD